MDGSTVLPEFFWDTDKGFELSDLLLSQNYIEIMPQAQDFGFKHAVVGH